MTNAPQSRPWWHPRRLLHPVPAAAVAGALLCGTAVAWQTDAGPFAADEVCWDALDRDALSPIIEAPDKLDAAELPPVGGRAPADGRLNGICRLSNEGERSTETLFTARVHRLSGGRYGASGEWARDFLSGRMSTLGSGLLGMASDERAWLALPDGCYGRPPELEGPTVVDVSGPYLRPGEDVDAGKRDALARLVVELVNAVSADLGCGGVIPDPVDDMPQPPRYAGSDEPGAFCGIDGLRPPSGRRADGFRSLVTTGHGPVRTCDEYYGDQESGLRLMTVEDPRLAGIYTYELLHGGTRIRGGTGYGSLRGDAGVFGAECQTGRVVFLVEVENADDSPDQVRALLARYAEAEAERLGCGPPELKLPRPRPE